MKILHTSDWHIGRTLHGVDLHAEQGAFIDFLVSHVAEHQIAALLISGDVYDRAIPSVESIELFSDALQRLSQHTTVIVTPGNHDSAARLGFGSAVMRDSVRILADTGKVDQPVIVGAGADQVAIYGIGYLDPDAARAQLATAGGLPERSHTGVLSAAMDRIRADFAQQPASKSVVLAHAFVIGAEESDSERDISVGGVSSVSSQVFDGIDYVALGHLHRPQVVPVPGSATVARYSGSPLAYSFSERHHKKSVCIVDLGAAEPQIDLVELPVPRPLVQLQANLQWLLSPATDEHINSWVKLIVTDTAVDPHFHAQLRTKFEHVLQLTHEPSEPVGNTFAPCVTESMSPAAVTGEFVEFVSTVPVDAAESELIDQAYRLARASQVGQ